MNGQKAAQSKRAIREGVTGCAFLVGTACAGLILVGFYETASAVAIGAVLGWISRGRANG